jgi:uncharacterized protein YndB with AHSA1/START domain
MKKTVATEKAPRMSDAAIRVKTGKTWREWFAVLDKAGASQMNRKEIATYLRDHCQLGGWWQQMLTGGYEQARGLREKRQKPEGYEISVSRIIPVSVARLYKAWQDDQTRRRWLPGIPIVIHKATPPKSLRITWKDGEKSVDVNFYPKGNNKSQVVVQHRKLWDARTAAGMQAYWSRTLDRLQEILGA